VKEPIPIGPGPWGGDGGKPWDDGVYTGVKQIYIMRNDFIGSIQIEYDRSGQSIWSTKHGNGGQITHRVSSEYSQSAIQLFFALKIIKKKFCEASHNYVQFLIIKTHIV
jgi:hypothetical protein